MGITFSRIGRVNSSAGSRAASDTATWTTAAAISVISSWTKATADRAVWSRPSSRARRPPRRASSQATASWQSAIAGGKEIGACDSLEAELRTTQPKEQIELTVRLPKEPKPGQLAVGDNAAHNVQRLTATLIRRPLEVVRPERQKPSLDWVRNGPTDAINLTDNCPASFLTTLQQVDDDKLRADEDPNLTFEQDLLQQLPGVDLRDVLWTIESPQKGDDVATKVVFSCEVAKYHLKVTKTYELAKVDADGGDDTAYHLTLSVAIKNLDTKKHEVAYRQDGPNGLPTEGNWYASTKVGRTWSTEGRATTTNWPMATWASRLARSFPEKGVDKTDKFRRDIGESSSSPSIRRSFSRSTPSTFPRRLCPTPNRPR